MIDAPSIFNSTTAIFTSERLSHIDPAQIPEKNEIFLGRLMSGSDIFIVGDKLVLWRLVATCGLRLFWYGGHSVAATEYVVGRIANREIAQKQFL